MRGCVLPQRVVLALMAFSAVALSYMLRISLSYAITKMVKEPHGKGSSKNNTEVCPPDDDDIFAATDSSMRYDWSQELQGLILSSFYWGYLITHVPGGLMSASIGGKYILLLGVAIAAVFSLFTPLAITKGGATALIIFRIIIGMGEGVIFPACNTLLAAWTPLKERSTTATVVYSGGMMGAIFGSSISGLLISEYGWSSVFYWFGGIAVIWCIVFHFICYDNPGSNPFISEEEKDYLNRELGELKRRDDLPPTPWRAMLTSLPVIALIVAQVGHSWGLFIIINDLPKYMNDVLRFSIKKNGLYTALPYLCLWIVALCTGFLSDFLIKRKYLSITFSRKLFTTISAIGPGVFILWASYAGCRRGLVVILFTIGMGFMGTFYSGIKANSLDLSPNYAGILMAVVNGTGALAGVIGPYIVGVLTTNSYLTEWRLVFWITFIQFVVTTIIYDIFASGKIQPWNDPK